jgi:hypothetical protein
LGQTSTDDSPRIHPAKRQLSAFGLTLAFFFSLYNARTQARKAQENPADVSDVFAFALKQKW